jgi:hypothetical protein
MLQKQHATLPWYNVTMAVSFFWGGGQVYMLIVPLLHVERAKSHTPSLPLVRNRDNNVMYIYYNLVKNIYGPHMWPVSHSVWQQ